MIFFILLYLAIGLYLVVSATLEPDAKNIIKDYRESFAPIGVLLLVLVSIVIVIVWPAVVVSTFLNPDDEGI